MAAKKTAKKAAKTADATTGKPAKKAAAKKTAAKVAKVEKAPKSEKSPKEVKAPKPEKKTALPIEEVAKGAYLNYRRRVENGLPGDSHGDWLEAERQLREVEAR